MLTFVTVFGQLLPVVLPAIFDLAADAAFPGDNGVIAFQHEITTTDFDIWVMNGDGSGKTQLTSGTDFDGAASMSPFGDRIAFQRIPVGFETSIWVMNVDGTEQTQLTFTDGWTDQFPAWSPDGRFIAYVQTRDGNSDIYTVDTDNGTQTPLTSDASLDRQPSWSPDGTKIAFDRGSPTGTPRQIFVMNADGTGATALTTVGDNTDPNWSPDRNQIVFTSNRDGNREIYVMNADGTGQTRVTDDAAFDADPAYSPEGDRIVFTSNRSGNFEIYTVSPAGGAVTVLTSAPGSDTFPDWGPTVTLRSIRGTVSNPDKSPAADVLVRAFNASGGAILDTDTTDGKGNYALFVPRGTYHVAFYPSTQDLAVQFYDGHTSGGFADDVVVNAGDVFGIDAFLVDAHAITGTVRSAGAPVPGAAVEVYDGSNCCYLIREVLTDEAGNYRVGLASGTYKIRFSMVGFVDQWWDHKDNGSDTATGWRAADVLIIEAPRSEVDADLVTPALTGVAACLRDIGPAVIVTTTLPNTTVTLLSGSTVIATTQSDADATYSFTGLAPNAPLTVQYAGTVDGVFHSCNVNVTTDATGGGAVPEAAPVINLGNHTWIGAVEMNSGDAVSDVIDQPYRRTFYKLTVGAQQIVTVQLTNLTRNYQLLGYSDIKAAADRLIRSIIGTGTEAEKLAGLRNLVSSGAVSAGDLDSGDLDSGDLDSGDLDSGDLDSGDLDSVDLDSGYAITYQSAQRAALRYASGHAGTAPEGFTIHTRGYSGDLYFAVVGHDGAFDSSGVFQIRADVASESTACDGALLTPRAPSAVTFPSGKTTLILTNSAALDYTGTTKTALLDGLGALASSSLNGFAVNGFFYDLDDNAGVKEMLTRVAGHPNCVPLVNLATDTIKALIWGPGSFRDASPNAEYVVFAGGDHAIPFRRISDLTFAGEINYSPPVGGTSGASLANNFYLTDSFYLAASPVERKGQLVWVTEMSGGRLVESATEILKNVDVYTARGGVFTPTSSLLAGYQFNTDLVDELQTGLQAGGANPVRLPDDVWGASDLRSALLAPNSPRFDVIAPQAHYTATRLIPADNGQRLLSTEIAEPASDPRFEGTVWLTIGCHSGYNIVDADAIQPVIETAFPEAILRRGGFLYGGTGYQFGDDEILANTEKLLANVMNEWRYRQDASYALYPSLQVPLGKALSNARNTYFNELRSVRDIDRKVADVATFYGLPFYRVVLASGRLDRPAETITDTTPIPGATGLSFSDVVASFTLTPHVGTAGGTFFDAGPNAVTAMAARPILPSTVQSVRGRLGGAPTLPHGVVLRDATYTTVSNTPVLAMPQTEDTVPAPSTFHNSAFSPWMFDLNVLARDRLVFTPAQYLSGPMGTSGQLRKYSSIGTRVYYSTRTDASALFGSPLVRGITLTDVGGRVHVDVTLFTLGTSTVQAAMFTYTGTTTPLSTKWKTVDLLGETPVAVIGNGVTVGHLQQWHTVAPGPDAPAGSLDIDPKDGVGGSTATVNDVFGVLQAVSDTGDVVADTNQMRLYSIPQVSATEAQPKIPTTLVVTTPSPLSLPLSTTYGATIRVNALLTSPGLGGLDGKRVIVRLGRSSIRATTGSDGAVEVDVPVNVLPGSYQVRVSFAEDDTALGSSAQFAVTVQKARPAFEPNTGSATVQYSDNVGLGLLQTPTGQILRWQPITLTPPSTSPLQQVASFTDGTGTARLDTMDFGGLAAGTYEIVATYPGDGVRYEAATSGTFTVTVQKENATPAAVPAPQQTGVVTVQGTLGQEGPPADRAPGDNTLAGIHYVATNELGATFSGDATVAADGTWSFTRTLGAGVFNIALTVTGDYYTGSSSAIAVVYDPTTFGTGGGTIVLSDTALPVAGRGKKANFGFNVKYKDGTTIPTGSLLFQLKEADIELKATSFDWLAISPEGSGKRAEFQAVATINGSGSYTVRVIARDMPTGDTFSIEVRDAAGNLVVSASGAPVVSGSIKVH